MTGALTPVPWMEKLKGFSSASLLVMVSTAFLTPLDAGANFTWKLVVPVKVGMVAAGIAMIMKSAALGPLIAT